MGPEYLAPHAVVVTLPELAKPLSKAVSKEWMC